MHLASSGSSKKVKDKGFGKPAKDKRYCALFMQQMLSVEQDSF